MQEVHSWRGGIFNSLKNDLSTNAAWPNPTNSGNWIDNCSTSIWAGEGTFRDPYLITSEKELAAVAYRVNQGQYSDCVFRLTKNLDMKDYYWTPIGTITNTFQGRFYGKNYTISNIYINSNANLGLFGVIEEAIIGDVVVENSYIRGTTFVGGIIGNASFACLISNCHFKGGEISVSSDFAGGIVGRITAFKDSNIAGCVIEQCSNSGKLTRNGDGRYVGGIVGYFIGSTNLDDDSFIMNCYNRGLIEGYNYVGGIVGYITNLFLVANCYNTGNIMAATICGGIGGSSANLNANSKIVNCYNVGNILGNSSARAIIGSSTSLLLSKCYFGGNCDLTSPGGSSASTIGKVTMEQVKVITWYRTSSNWDREYPWDFVNVWEIYNGHNDNFPIFIIVSTLTINPNGGSCQGDSSVQSITKANDYVLNLQNPIREGFNFAGWKLEYGGNLVSGMPAKGGFTTNSRVDNDGSVYMNFHGEYDKPSSSQWLTCMFDKYTFVDGHEYQISYGVRINTLQGGVGIDFRHSRLENDWATPCGNTFYGKTNGWKYYEMSQVLYTSCDLGETNPLFAIWTGDLKNSTENKIIYDFDLKNIVIMDVTNNTIAWTSQKFTFGQNDATLTALWVEKTWDQFAADSYAGGSGTQTDPYTIATAEQLAKLSKDSMKNSFENVYFKQIDNIDLNAHFWSGIGVTSDRPFKGNYDGGMHFIANLRMYQTGAVGLFNVTESAIMSKIHLIDSEIKTIRGDAGGIVGINGGTSGANPSIVQDCIVERSTIICEDKTFGSIGGISGAWGQVKNCIVKDSTIDGDWAGGISGYNPIMTKDCSALNVTIIGRSEKQIVSRVKNNIQSCYGYGSINGASVKVLYGDSSVWGNWSYTANINNGYPLQNNLFWVVGQSGSDNVYNYLKNLGFSDG